MLWTGASRQSDSFRMRIQGPRLLSVLTSGQFEVDPEIARRLHDVFVSGTTLLTNAELLTSPTPPPQDQVLIAEAERTSDTSENLP